MRNSTHISCLTVGWSSSARPLIFRLFIVTKIRVLHIAYQMEHHFISTILPVPLCKACMRIRRRNAAVCSASVHGREASFFAGHVMSILT
ncbi:hypothetical protein CEXT_642991 [Caerostris extrusa]|uniref:Secreted protein n=1 Tax=Caerostris extrusa TaxID=172846 RepID=A0AAV4X1Z1_CAEEX|nr:hypothetical protein CEXT_642991 [Caerostris extrusa]